MFAEVCAWEAPPGGARVREHAVPAVPSGAFSPLPALPPLGGPAGGGCALPGCAAPRLLTWRADGRELELHELSLGAEVADAGLRLRFPAPLLGGVLASTDASYDQHPGVLLAVLTADGCAHALRLPAPAALAALGRPGDSVLAGAPRITSADVSAALGRLDRCGARAMRPPGACGRGAVARGGGSRVRVSRAHSLRAAGPRRRAWPAAR